jgi:hypothetical protein
MRSHRGPEVDRSRFAAFGREMLVRGPRKRQRTDLVAQKLRAGNQRCLSVILSISW